MEGVLVVEGFTLDGISDSVRLESTEFNVATSMFHAVLKDRTLWLACEPSDSSSESGASPSREKTNGCGIVGKFSSSWKVSSNIDLL